MLPVRRTAGLGPTLGAALALAMLVGACSSPGGSSIGVTGAWVRAAAMTAPSTAAYMTIANPGSAGDALVGVSSAVATTAEVHETMVVAASATPAASDGMGGASPMPGASAGGGMMGMQPVARLEIPAGGVVVLEPGSYHVMLIGLKQDLKAGDSVTLTLTFEKAGTVTVTAPVGGTEVTAPMTDGTPGTVHRPSPAGRPRPDTPSTMAAPPRPVAPTRLALLAVLVIGFAALAGIAVGAVAYLSVLSAPPATGSGGAYIWPASPTPSGLDRDTAVRPAAPAPPIHLTDQDGRPFDLASLRGEPVVVFFGYTHCPDVCPTNLADVRDALKQVSGKVGVVFVTIDPARDNAAAMKQYVDSYQAGFTGLTGSDDEIRAAAGAWGVSYAKVETGSAAGYAMAHTADTFLVDAQGRLRHRIWFGAGPEIIAARINGLATEAIQTPAPTASAVLTPNPTVPPVATPWGSASPTPPAPTGGPASTPPSPPPSGVPTGQTAVVVKLQSSVVRAGTNRIVVTVSDPNNRELAKPDVVSTFAFRSTDDPSLAPIEVPGMFIWVVRGGKAAFVAEMTLPRAGGYAATITLDGPGGRIGSGDFTMVAREQSPTPPIGSQAPSVRTPIAADVGGNLALITSDVFPNPSFYEHSVDELLAAHKPFVFTIYSPAFCPTTACGPLLRYMKEMAPEFPNITFVHAEPYVMQNLGGRIQPLYDEGKLAWAPWSLAYGIPVEPYVFVVNGNGTIVASFELIVGSDEIRAAIHTATGE